MTNYSTDHTYDPANQAQRMARLETEAAGLKNSLDRVEKAVDSLTSRLNAENHTLQATSDAMFKQLDSKIDERTKPRWGELLSAAGLVIIIIGGVGTYSLEWQTDLIRRNAAQVEKMEARMSGEETSDNARIEHKLADFENKLVPRSEHMEKWHGQEITDSAMEREINLLRADLAHLNEQVGPGTYGVKDALADMRQQLLREEEELHRLEMGGSITPILPVIPSVPSVRH